MTIRLKATPKRLTVDLVSFNGVYLITVATSIYGTRRSDTFLSKIMKATRTDPAIKTYTDNVSFYFPSSFTPIGPILHTIFLKHFYNVDNDDNLL